MIKRTIIKNGKKYIVNTAGWNDEVGPATSDGTLLMRSITDGNWYAVTLTGTSASAAISINQTASTWQSPGQDFGYQLIFDGYNGNVAQLYLSGSSGDVVPIIAAWSLSSDYKPYLFLQSTDGNFYKVNVSGSSLVVDQDSKWAPSWPNAIPPYTLYY